MKLILTIATVGVLFNGAAFAAEKYTNEQINQVIEARGLPPLGGSRVLHDSDKKEHTSVLLSTSNITSNSTITRK